MIYPVTTRNDAVVSDLSIVEPPLHLTFAGRTGIEIFDWDNDGHMDIITHKHRGTVLYYRNTGKGEAIFEPARVLFDFDSHLAGPAVMDYNQDGYPDIVLGGDRKRYVGEKKLYPKPNHED
ncbi:MAG: VCBS repeat-containing protein [Cytophagales bacterium]|nr:VCBS repeat-containing protein [Cytophagales bacterium]